MLCNIILKIVSFGMYLRWDKNNYKRLDGLKISADERLWIIIPVYEEVDLVEKSYRCFSNIVNKSKLNIHVIYACTERESPTRTLTVLQKLGGNENIHILNAPASRKFMAGQINFAIESIDKQQEAYKFVIYNVDSRPDLESLESNFKLLFKYPVVQQYGDYSNNIPKDSKTIRDFVYLNTFLWQNSWSKQFEIRNTIWNKLFKCFSKFSYVVGHGMFLNREVLNITGLLSERIQNEDMELSIRLHEHKIPIESGFGFSQSDMPLSISDYIKQQTVWARGPMMAFKYITGQKQFFPAMKLFLHFVYWLIEPILMILLIVLSVLSGSLPILLVIFIIYFMCVLCLPNLKYASNIKKYPLKYTISCFIFFVIHSFGPIITLKNVLLEKIGLRTEHKFKTPKA